MITQVLQRYIERKREAQQKDHEGPQTHWYPSSLGKCERAVILKRAGELEPIPLEEKTKRVFWMGDEIHDALKKAVDSDLKVVGHELRVRSDLDGVSGRLDTLLYNNDDELEVVEYKSIKSTGFDRGLPQDAHVLQLGIYLTYNSQNPCGCLRDEDYMCDNCVTPWKCNGPHSAAEHGEGCDGWGDFNVVPNKGRLVYFSKDDARIAEYQVAASEHLSDKVRAALSKLTIFWHEYLERKTLPPILPLETVTWRGKRTTRIDWRTKYCDFRGSGYCCGDLQSESKRYIEDPNDIIAYNALKASEHEREREVRAGEPVSP